MRRTVQPSQQIEQRIDALLAGGVDARQGTEVLSELARLGAQLIIQRAVEQEFDEFLGRARYERSPQALPGKRNGYRPRKVGSGEGELVIEIPQLREAAEPFVSKLFPRGHRYLRTAPLQALVIGAFVRGLSMRDVESVCREAGLGRVSKSTASVICRQLKDRFAAFKQRSMTGARFVALFLDAKYLHTRPSGPKEGVLVAWGITDQGQRMLADVELGIHESGEDWLDVGRDLTRRGMPEPMMLVTDGAPGAISAIEQLWPGSIRQRCTVHKIRNVLAKLPDTQRAPIKAAYWDVLDTAASVDEGEQGMRQLVGSLSDQGYDRAAACLADDLPALVAHLTLPPRHRRKWRSTNLLERTIGEIERRAKVIGRFPGETSCLSLVWAVMDLVITHATNVVFTDIERAHLARLKQHPPTADTQAA